jgi:hypothetical protein
MRRTLAVSVLVAAGIALAACGDGGSPSATGTTAGAPATGTTTTGAPGGGADPVCAEVTRTVQEATTKTQEEIAKAATASDADLQKSLQTVKQIYTSAGTSIKTSAGNAVNPELKSALDTLASEATKVADSLDPSMGAAQALALMDQTKITAAAERVRQACGQP